MRNKASEKEPCMRNPRKWIGVIAVAILATNAIAVPQKNQGSKPNETSRISAAAPSVAHPSTKAESSAKHSEANLPVRRVVLYKSGLGYFEHQGQVQGNQTVSIDFTSSQLNDVLQSLTLLDLNGGRITGV